MYVCYCITLFFGLTAYCVRVCVTVPERLYIAICPTEAPEFGCSYKVHNFSFVDQIDINRGCTSSTIGKVRGIP
ncbi:protein of unknown function (plasmid) [Cupriavidus taiwanensis]|uniref:Uncharacterized protein n=1 Tax=Cupriavidus taiwanensis TaxID=164546 RepID=A0A375FHQ8_9BURK|nr:protein of unknown function [Cupriavidus taiwanensis]SPA11301.1 protein of unknown function [Cupriavidus taiwanensis]SPA57268.1 protein of unknown function [Cupriavidus taiwanensis]SPD48885.1 protein of unknown function [Cupriavidus taiwanensis]